VLLRWHVNRPPHVLNADGVVAEVKAAIETAFGPGQVDVGAQAEPAATDRQRALVDELVNKASAGWYRDSVVNVRDYNDSQVGRLRDTAGSFLLVAP
jgi:hypothetical protein